MRPQLKHYLLAALLAMASTSQIRAQTSAFTYQGRLTDSGSPANGLYDLRFWLAENSGGHYLVIAGPLTNNAVMVSNGLFNLPLDFGADAFPGDDRYLYIEVRTNGAGDFAELLPLQQITSAPYAIKATHATTVTMGTISNPTFLGTTNSAALELEVNSETGLRLEYPTYGNVPNLIGGYSGNSIGPDSYASAISGGGSGSFPNSIGSNNFAASISGGNANEIGSNALGDVIGGGQNNGVNVQKIIESIYRGSGVNTISGGGDNQIQDNGLGNTVGGGVHNVIEADVVGATISGGWAARIGLESDYSAIGGGEDNVIQANAIYAVIPGGYLNTVRSNANHAFAAGYRAKANHPGSFVWADSTDADFASTAINQFNIRADGGVRVETSGAGMTIDGEQVYAGNDVALRTGGNAFTGNQTVTGGDVGIGTASPGARLEVAGGNFLNSAVRHRNSSSGNTNVWDIGQRVISSSEHYLSFENNGTPELALRNTGRVGIGTTSPEGDVHIRGNSSTGSLIVTPNTANSQSQLLLCENTSASFGMIMRYAGGDADNPLHFIGWNGDVEGSPLMTIERTGGGNVGIGVSNPAEKLEVAGNITATGTINGSSDRNRKENFEHVDVLGVLEKVAAMPIQRWNYIGEETPHLGPVAQDFYGAFQVGMDDKHISMVDADGVALAAIQGLHQTLQQKETELAELRQQLAEVRRLMETMLTTEQ